MIRLFFDLSSRHLTAAPCAWLDAQMSHDLLRDPAAEHASQIAGRWTRYGWFVYAPKDMPMGIPQDLMAALRIARAQGAEYVLFDCDAVPSADLPVLHPDFLG